MTTTPTSKEYRADIAVPGLTHNQGVELLAWLSEYTDTGPVLSGPGPGGAPATITVSTDRATDRAKAIAVLVRSITDGLQATGRTDLFPARIELETEPV